MDSTDSKDAFALPRLYKYLRVADVSDALDGIGYFNLGLMSPEIRPLWAGMKFWGVAFTMRCIPANRPMWRLKSTQEIVDAHSIWFKEVPALNFSGMIKQGHVIVTDTGGSPEVGYWGSFNTLCAVADGAVGIVTDGCVRDSAEIVLERIPICARARGRTIMPGRLQEVEAGSAIGCGGVQVRAGDIIGCDDDGVIVVPQEVAGEVAVHARAVLLHDMRMRRQVYERSGRQMDASVDCETVEAYYDGLD
ncbi:MAG: RraA family protein [Armatimonadetes bacterium]|nr:RraA family protein [Armatimonadota bacterium]NIM23946.1 RraA family protein [Armatimonadota bacterium]NIM67793.1 RraA family protein [Armatimonadota bacterium]NIM76333.1 RraA family protein [Armatimonadota bacterium]NIN06027.1 RraA family protein [Armatimonadota bacterium]